MKRLMITGLGVCAMLTGCSSGFNHPVRELTATTGPDKIQHVRVTTHTFWFEPNRIVVKRGIPVDLTVQNGAMFVPHDFACHASEAGVELDMRVGMFHGSRRVQFTPTRVGEYPFHCGVDSHAKKGMMGMLVVVEP